MWLKVGNFVWFQTVWWLIILFQNNAILPVVALIGVWLVLSPQRAADIKLMSIMLVIGTVVDGLLTNGGLFNFTEQNALIPFWPIPIWLSLLWVAFSGTVHHSMDAFKGRYALCAVGGAIFAPLSYIAGARFDAVELGASYIVSYAIIAAVWSVVFPLCFYISSKLLKTQLTPNIQGESTYE